jgi:hypothetical protein
LVLLGCNETKVTTKKYDSVASFTEVQLKDEQGHDVSLKKDMPIYTALVTDTGVLVKINMKLVPNEVHVTDEKTNKEIKSSKWKDGYPFVPYPKGFGLYKYKMIAIWNNPNEYHVHEAIVKFEIQNK